MEQNQMIEDVTDQYSQDRYAMYLRKSRADLELEAMGEGETLARHTDKLNALAAKYDIHPGQIDVYREVVSGESIDARPEVQRLLTNIYKKKYKGVLVVEVERLARGNTRDQGEIADAFAASGTKILTPMKIYDPEDENDMEYFEFGLFMSRREYKTITRRMLGGKDQSSEEGNYLSSARPYGFDIVRKSRKDRILVPKPEEIKIVHMIFDWWTEDKKSIGWIATELTHMGIPTVKNMPEWNRETVRGILSNVNYIGLIRWNQKKTVKEFDPKTGKMVKVRKKAEVELYKGKHDPVLSEEQFEKAQSRFQKQLPIHTEKVVKNPLAGIMRCADCGKNITLHPFSQKPTTSGRYTHPRSVLCKKKSVVANVCIDALVATLKLFIEDFEYKLSHDGNKDDIARYNKHIKSLETELAKQEKMKRRLFDSWEADDGTYTKDEFIERKQKYTKTIASLKEQIASAKESAPAPVDYKEKIGNLHKIIDCIKDTELSAKEKNDFLKEHIDVITYDIEDLGMNKGGKLILDVKLK